jgi:hypothetical protein
MKLNTNKFDLNPFRIFQIYVSTDGQTIFHHYAVMQRKASSLYFLILFIITANCDVSCYF